MRRRRRFEQLRFPPSNDGAEKASFTLRRQFLLGLEEKEDWVI